MPPERREPAGRPRRPRGSLTADVILDAAEALATEGLAALSMRAIATRLEAAPMALYNHFATKEELVDALLDRVLGRFEPAPATGDLATDLRGFARAHRRLLAEHAWAVAPLVTHPNPGLGAVRIGELALGILRRGGLSDTQAVAAFSGIIALNYGWSSFTAARDADPRAPGHDVGATLAALPRTQFPLTVDLATELGAYGSPRHYDFVLELLLRGLTTRADPGRDPSPAADP